MKKACLLIFLLFTIALAEENYELPDLGLTVEDPHCGNAEELLPLAQKDLERTSNFQTNTKQQIQYLTNALESTQKACELNQQPEEAINPLGSSMNNILLQMNSRKKGVKKSGFIQHKLAEPSKDASKLEKIVAEKMRASIALISQDMSSTQPNFGLPQHCRDLTQNLNDTLTYLQWVDEQLTKVVDNLLPCRIDKLKSLIERCKHHTQVGTWGKTYLGTNHIFEKDSEDLRSEDYTITFEEPFVEVPNVAISLTGFDVDKTFPGLFITIQDVTTSTFVIRIFAYAHVKLYMIQLSWIATISSKSGIYISHRKVDYKEDSEWLEKYQDPPGEKSITRTISHPTILNDPAIAIGVSGFLFDGSKNGRLQVDAQNIDQEQFDLVIKTWWDSILYSASVYILHYDKVVGVKGVYIQESSSGATLYNGSEERTEEFKAKIDANCCGSIVAWTGLKKIDIDDEANYRFKAETTITAVENRQYDLSIKYNTWADTKIWSVAANIFYTNDHED